MNVHKNAKGFTLIELALYGGLLGILLVILSEFFVAIMSVDSVSKSDTAVDIDGKYILGRMTYDIRHSVSVLVPDVSGGLSATLSGYVDYGSGQTSYRYTLENGLLTLGIGAFSDRLNSNQTRVSNFSVSRAGTTIRLSFSVSPVASLSGDTHREYETTVGMR